MFAVPTQHMYGVMYRDELARGYSGMMWHTYLFDTEKEREDMILDLRSDTSAWSKEFVAIIRIEVDVPVTVTEQYAADQERINTAYGAD